MALKYTQEQIGIVRNWAQFDADWYLDEYPDVRLAAMDPAYHYLWLGHRIGRRPSASFVDFIRDDLEPLEILRRIQGEGGGANRNRNALDTYYRARPTIPAEFMAVGEADIAALGERSIAVHVHMYYADLSEEFAAYLSRIPCTFDLYVSVSDEASRSLVISVFSKISKVGRIDVRIVPNRGRDIAPFVVEFGSILSGYDIVSHIQTKRSLYNKGATDGWRNYILEALFPESARLTFLLRALSHEQYGIIYPQTFFNLPYLAHTWLANLEQARVWASRFGVSALPDGYFDFPAGSMFWARTDAIRPLLEAGLTWDDFPPEQGQTDGTLAHCIERMFGVVPTSRKFRHGVIADQQYPSWSRWRISQFLDRPAEFVTAVIKDENVKVVAFDIFDTLLLRHFIDPDYVKTILQRRYESRGILGFRELRQRYESEARSAKSGGDVDIHEIYAQIKRGEADTGRVFAVEDEIALETSSVLPRPGVIEVLNFAVAAGKRVVLVSDMFLTRDVIEDMLRKCNVSGWQKLYLSSEIGLRKDRGDMYSYILKEEKISAEQLLMIGDNERSDLQIPADMGAKILHAMKPISVMRAIPRLEDVVPDAAASSGDQFLFGALAAKSFAGMSFPHFSHNNLFGKSAESIGYGLLGPISLAFSQCLVATSRSLNLKRLNFLAREGKFLKLAFDTWATGLELETSSAYLVVSRRAVTVPAIEDLEDIYRIAASNNFYGEVLDVFLKERYGVSLDASMWRQIEDNCLWKQDRPLTIMQGHIEDVRPLLTFIAPMIFARAKLERESALKYLKQMQVTAEDRSAVVDVGYGGTIQRHLGKLLNVKVSGLYMMINEGAEAWATSEKVILRGFFGGVMPDAPDKPSIMFANSFLLEKMLSANDEQLMHYQLDGGFVFREFQDYVGAGQKVRDEMQHGAIRFIQDAVRFRDTFDAEMVVTPERAQGLFERFVEGQSSDEKRAFSTLLLDDFYCGRGVVMA